MFAVVEVKASSVVLAVSPSLVKVLPSNP